MKISVLLKLIFTSDSPDCCHADSDTTQNPITPDVVYRSRSTCITIAGKSISDTKYDSKVCPDQYGTWASWEECKSKTDCSGSSLGFWQRTRTVCSSFTALTYTDTETLACATGYAGATCADCQNGYYKNTDSECIGKSIFAGFSQIIYLCILS